MQKASCSCPPPPVPAGVHVWLVLLKTHQAIGRVAAARLKDSGLGESEFRVLELLLHKGAMPVNALGPRVYLTPGSISTAVDRLYTRGLVTRDEDPADRRVRRVDLTAQGRCLIEAVFHRHAAEMEEIMGALSAGERGQLEALLKKVGLHAEAIGTGLPR